MADPQNDSRFAWALTIHAAPPIYAGSTDLSEEAAVSALGAFFTKRLKRIDVELKKSLPNLFYGIDTPESATFVLDNSDLRFTLLEEWRQIPVTLIHYDRTTHATVTDFTGVIVDLRPIGTEAHVTIGTHNTALLTEFLPFAVIDPVDGSPFETSATPGAPLPVIFGSNVPIRPPSAASADAVDEEGEPLGLVDGYEFIVGYGEITVKSVNVDNNPQKPGFEKLGTFTAAPGSPVLVSSTRFSVTGNQAKRFYTADENGAGTPIRFKTTAGGSAFLYSYVALYDTGVTPHQLQIEDALLGAGLNAVEIGGDYLINRDGYLDVTDGLYPNPGGSGADFTAIRLFDQEDGAPFAIVDNPTYPTSTTSIADVIGVTLLNPIWGLSARTQQTVSAGSFATANLALSAANLTGAIQGAYGYDQQQREAQGPLNELLMMRGMRMWLDDANDWNLTVDTEPTAATQTFSMAPGEHSGPRIKRITQHGKRPLSEAVRNVVLHWLPLGRALSSGQKFTPREYGRVSTASCTGFGKDLHLFSQWIRADPIAERVAFYVAKKLAGADETCTVVVGVEGRDLQLGQQIGLHIPSDGIYSFTGTWQISAISKTLGEVTLTCFRANATAYDAPSGVLTTDEPNETLQRSAITSVNLMPNPELGGPYTEFGEPFGWTIGNLTGGTVTGYWDYSAETQASTLSGHYVRITATADTTPVANAVAIFAAGIQTFGAHIPFACPANANLILSFYCDQTSGVYATVVYVADGFVETLVTLVYDPTDTTPNGWGRYYARLKSPAATTTMFVSVNIATAGTYQIEAVQLERPSVSGRRPSPWRRHKPQPLSLTASATVTFSGGTTSSTATNLIPAGVKVKAVTGRITTAIGFGTATHWSVGTVISPDAWGTWDLVANNQTTSAAEQNMPLGSGATGGTGFLVTGDTYFSAATSVLLTANGTVTSGAVRLTVEYERPAPPSRETD